VDGTDVVAAAGGHRSVGGITEDDGIDLVWIVFVIVSRGSGCVGGSGGAGAIGCEVCLFVVLQRIEDRGEGKDGGNGSEQDGSGAERLARSDVEAGGSESGSSGGEGLLHGDPPVLRRRAGSKESGEVGRYW
jgi:hypothetical protein